MLLLLLTFHCFSVIDWFHRGVKELEEVVVLLVLSTQLGTEFKVHYHLGRYHLVSFITEDRCSHSRT